MKRYVVVISNNLGTFKVSLPVKAMNPRNASKRAMEQVGDRTPALGTLRVVSVHERGDA